LQYLIICLLLFSGCSREFTNPYDPGVSPVDWKPKNLEISVISTRKVDLNWESGTQVPTLYVVERKTNDGDYVELGSTGLTVFTDSTLSEGTESYKYRVRAIVDERSSDPAPGKTIQWQTIGTKIWEDNFPSHVRRVEFTHSGNTLIVADMAGTIRAYDGYSSVIKWSTSIVGAIEDISINSGDTRLAVGSSQSQANGSTNSLSLFDMKNGKSLWTKDFSRQIVSVKFSEDDSKIATGSFDNRVRLHQATNGEEIWWGGNGYFVNAVDISSDGEKVVSGSWDHFVRCWDYQTGEMLWESEHEGEVWIAQYSSDNSFIAMGVSGYAKILNSNTGTVTWNENYGGNLTNLDISPDNKLAVFGHFNGTKCIDVDSGTQLWSSGWGGYDVTFNHSGDKAAGANASGFVTIWDSRWGIVRWTGSHEGTVNNINFSSDDWLLASGSADQMVRVWIARNGWIVIDD
ncbi:MAG: PQQ-binding-like beta-propeller repeat protein, partial [Candidatus Marinimicrobia bacterium]|nr:PQQ-binding-like beta-propeller repeat protein [Candidatus Neomarinimicrobiota bacterium]